MKANLFILSNVLLASLSGSAFAQSSATPDPNAPQTQQQQNQKPLSGTQIDDYNSAVKLENYRADSPYSIRASNLMGLEVLNANNEEIGEIEDLVITRDERPLKAIVSVGGFLGVGERLVAVPYEDLRIKRDASGVYLGMTKEQLETQPEFRYEEGQSM